MKKGKGAVKVVMSLLILSEILIIVSLLGGFYSSWMGYLLLALFVMFILMYILQSVIKRINKREDEAMNRMHEQIEYIKDLDIYESTSTRAGRHSNNIMLFSYLLIAFAILLQQKKVISVEWAFLAFIVSAVVFFIFRIDSRYLILPAIVFLFYCPFLLICKLDAFAEDVAIYAYYFLVVGVVLQFIEMRWERKLSLDFVRIMELIKNRQWIYYLLVAVIAFTLIRLFFPFVIFLKATMAWLSAVFFVLYLIQKLVD